MIPGPLLFVRYAYPPNSLGYCGPADSAALRGYGTAGVVDPGLVQLARAFAGAWPYLELIAHHSFHVFGVYPWVGLLGDDRKADRALTVLDRCRIRWGRVRAIHGEQVVVEYRPLVWDGRYLSLGEPATETARTGLFPDLAVGDRVSLHWDWVCDRLTDRQLRALRGYTLAHLDLVNHRVEHPGPAAALR